MTVEELVIKIKADATDAENKLNSFSTKMKNVGDSITKVTAPLAAMGTAITAGLTSLIMKAANTGDALADMSRRTGVSVEDLSRLKFAAEISGTSIDGIETSLKFLTRAMDDAQNGTGKAKDAFEKLGITVTDSDGKLRPITDVLVDAATKISEMDNSAEQAAVTMEIFGARSGTDLLPLLKEGGEGIKDLMNKADDLGITISTKSATAADDFKDKLTELKGSLEGVTTSIGTALMPVVLDLIETYVKPLIERIKEIPLEKLKEWFEKLVPVIGILVGAMVLGKLVSIFSSLASPAGLIALLIAGIVLLVENWGKVKEAFKKFYEDHIKPWLDPLLQGLKDIVGFIEKIINAVKGTVGKVINWFKGGTTTETEIPPYAGGFASGGSFTVSRPTMFMAGERGTERVNITPQGKDESIPLLKEILKEVRKLNEITTPDLGRKISLSVSGLGSKV